MAENTDTTQVLEQTNLAFGIEEEVLTKMGDSCAQVYEEDLDSRSDWTKANEEWLKLATQVVEKKTYPWPGASNVKYPLLSTAALQFNARAYPALLPDSGIVRVRVLGDDDTGAKADKADRVSQHMSWQLMEEDPEWAADQDRLLYVLPIIGLAYKKSYHSSLLGRNVSRLVLPDDLVINYYAENYERAIKSHRMYQDENEIYELTAIDHYIEQDLQEPNTATEHEGVEDDIIGLDAPSRGDIDEDALNDTPYEIIEQHTWWDLDGDGYKEPYIITFDLESRKVLRVIARWEEDSITYTNDGDIARIAPTEYFTHYGFFPNPESKIYFQGFGSLLGPINAASNTILNQLLDAGHMSNLQAGFLGKGIRMRGGKLKFKPGEWKIIQSTGEDIRKNVFPLPTREPSQVLFNLLGLLIEAGEKLSSVKDIMVGENPGQNQPYATTIAVLEQGMKVFIGIYKRIYRSMKAEYTRLYHLNSLYFDEKQYFLLLDADEASSIGPEDYDEKTLDIAPAADPSLMSEAQRRMKSESLLQKKAAGMPLNTMEITKRALEVEGQTDIQKLLEPDPPPPEDPNIALQRAQLMQKTQNDQKRLQLDAQSQQFAAFKDYSTAISNMATAAATAESSQQQAFIMLAKTAEEEYRAVTERLKVFQDGLLAEKENESTEEEPPNEENGTTV